MKFSLLTLGCKVNQSESSVIESDLIAGGHERVDLSCSPDICIVNTCTVTAKSDYQSRQLIRRALRTGAKVFATGCYSELHGSHIKTISSSVDIIPIKDKLRFYSQLIDINESNTLYKNISRSRSFIKIQDGCNNRCTYCAVHVARGISISRAQDEVIKEIHHVHSLGFKEVVLTGVNIGMYGWDLLPPSSLNTLLRIVLSSTEIPRIRLSSLEVNEIDDELIDIITNDRICRHLHIPLQSGCDKILKRMGRKYTVNYFEQKIEKIVSLFPDISIGSDIITGFPGEGDNSFIKTADFVRRNSFSYLHVFPYSMRDNTPASNFPDQVPDKIKQERVQELRGIASAKKIKYMEKFIGRTLDVIVEKKIDNSLYQATSGNYLKVRIASDGLERGVLLFTRIFGFQNGHLLGVPILMT